NHIAAIVESANDPRGYSYCSMFKSLGIAPTTLADITLYSIPAGTFAAYAGIAPETLEARATALRYDQLLEGVNRYVSAGKPVAELSPSSLYQAGGLPLDWFLSSLLRPDFQVLSADKRPAFALGGTYTALKPLATRASADGAEIFYPYPERWLGSRNYETHSLTPAMVFVFDASHLAAAAKKLKDSPPPEMTTPFLSLKTASVPR